MKYQWFVFFLIALIAEVGTSLSQWYVSAPRDGFQRDYDGSFLVYEVTRLIPWFVMFVLFASIWFVATRSVRAHKKGMTLEQDGKV